MIFKHSARVWIGARKSKRDLWIIGLVPKLYCCSMTKEIQLSWTFCTWLRGVLSKYDDESLLLFALVSICCLCLLLSFSDSNGPSEWKIVERTNDTLFLTLFLLFLSILARKIRRASFRDFYASFYLYVCAQRPHKISHFHKDNVTWKNSQKWLDGIYKRFSSILTLVISNTVLVFLWVAFTFFWICTASQKAVLYMYSTVELCMRRAVLDGC